MSRDSSAKYYQNNNEKLQKISLGKKEKETKVTAYFEQYKHLLKRKSKSLLSIEKNVAK